MAAMETSPAPTAPGTTPPATAGEPAVPKSKFSCELCGLDLDSGGLTLQIYCKNDVCILFLTSQCFYSLL